MSERSPSDGEDSSNRTRPNKVSKTQAGQDVARWAKPRRAARACDRCRASKLRCMPSTTVEGALKCAHCEKMDHDCVYTDLAPMINSRSGEASDRLSQLEANVSKLLGIMTGQHGVQGADLNAVAGPSTFSDIAPLYPSNLSPDIPPPDLLSLAVAAQTASQDEFDFQERPMMPWLSKDNAAVPTSLMQRDIIALPSLPDPPSTSSDEKYSSPQARPIPKSATSSRMAAFSDPYSHEAPFRCLAYNPDLFRNAEMSDGNGSREVGVGDGGKTPKRGKGDPIDRGIFSDAQARALFEFYCHEISFFLPICQEPMSFDHIRHRSSFLLSTILAIASKYSTRSRVSPSTSRFTSTVQEAYGVKPVEEDQWQQIRALSTLCYFQAMISKVHCLEDVQAALLLCAWGLQERGASPDPWMVAGSAYRLARRLGLHQIASNVASGAVAVTSRLLASWKTYLCLYALDRLFTVGFGRPETEGYEASTVETRQIISSMDTGEQYCSVESVAYTSAMVELANVARQYSHLVNITLKVDLHSGAAEKRYIGLCLDEYSRRWMWSRSSLAGKLGRSKRVIKLLYDHIRLCLYAVPGQPSAIDIGDTAKRSKKAEDTATSIIQSFADDLREDSDTTFCFAIDYVYMVLSHSAAYLLSSSVTRNLLESSSPQNHTTSSSKPGDRIDRNSAMRYCGMAITGLVGSDSSAIYFPSDMACNLCLIAKEVGMNVEDWVEAGVAQVLKQRADPENRVVEGVDANWFGEFIDWGMLSDLEFMPP